MSDLPRYRVTSQDGAPARFDESKTGYWTPWYIAERRCNDLRAKLEQAEAEVQRVRELAEKIRDIAIDSPASNNMQLIYRLACKQAERAGGDHG